MSRTAPCYPNNYQRLTARRPCSSLSKAGNCLTYFEKALPWKHSKELQTCVKSPIFRQTLEKAALEQRHYHFEINNLHEPFKSAYKPMHSTETALIRIMNDMLIDIDNRKVIFLALLDLSAAFNTVDQNRIARCRWQRFRMDKTLPNRTQWKSLCSRRHFGHR